MAGWGRIESIYDVNRLMSTYLDLFVLEKKVTEMEPVSSLNSFDQLTDVRCNRYLAMIKKYQLNV